jgi:hypothetical protein
LVGPVGQVLFSGRASGIVDQYFDRREQLFGPLHYRSAIGRIGYVRDHAGDRPVRERSAFRDCGIDLGQRSGTGDEHLRTLTRQRQRHHLAQASSATGDDDDASL